MEPTFAALSEAAQQLKSGKQNGLDMRAAATTGALAIIGLKRLNREVFDDVDVRRQRTLEAKQQVRSCRCYIFLFFFYAINGFIL